MYQIAANPRLAAFYEQKLEERLEKERNGKSSWQDVCRS